MINLESKFYGNPIFGENCFFGSNVIIGYPDQTKLNLAIKEKKSIEQLVLSKVIIGSNCVFRDGSIVYEGVKISHNLRSGHYFLYFLTQVLPLVNISIVDYFLR